MKLPDSLVRGVVALWVSTPGQLIAAPSSPPASASPHQCLLPTDASRARTTDYRMRGNRCEGVFWQNISERINLRLVGYHAVAPAFDVAQASKVTFDIVTDNQDPAPARLLLRAISMRQGLNYQMDATVPGTRPQFAMDTDILSHPDVALSPASIAVLACAPDCSSLPTNHYFPVRLEDRSSTRRPAPEALFAVSVEVVSWEVRVRARGEAEFTVKQRSAEHVHSNEPFRVALTGTAPGLADVELVARTQQGLDTFSGVFYVPAP